MHLTLSCSQGFIIMVSTGELLSISQSSIFLHRRHSRPCFNTCTTASPVCTRPFLFYRPIHIKDHSRNHFSTSIKTHSVAPEKIPTGFSGDFTEKTDIGGIGGGDNYSGGGDNNSGGGSGGGGGEDSGDSQEEPKKFGMSMSQKLTLGYAALVGLGGLMGFLKSGSQKSLFSGGISAVLLYYVYTQLPANPVFASCIGLGLSAALMAVMGSRFKNSGKVFPAGVVAGVSLVMTGGYLHGVMRSLH